jgi:hypothetical protein
VQTHLRRLKAVDARIGRVYRDLSLVALDLARERGGVDPEALRSLAEILSGSGD